jgi:transposase
MSLSGGECHDMSIAPCLLSGLQARFVVGDKGYDSDALRSQLRQQGAIPVIPSRRGTRRRRHNKQLYQLRNIAERFINRLKHFRRVATRYDKLGANYLGFACLAAIITLK